MKKLYCFCLVLLMVMGNAGVVKKSFGRILEVVEMPKVVLSFDDVPSPATKIILRILKEEKVKATFFVVGRLAEEHPEILREILRDGHDVANHTQDHLDLSKLSYEQINEQIQRCSWSIFKITGIWPLFFRPPYGSYDDRVVETANECGLDLSLWTREGDCRYWIPIAVGQDAPDYLPRETVLLLHGGEKFGENDTFESIKYLRRLIHKLKVRFEIVKLSDL